MAKYSRVEVINTVLEIGLIPVFNNDNLETAIKIVNVCADGGARVIEFTNRSEFAYKIFSELVEYFSKNRMEVILGVGSVIDAPTAAIYIANGANFVVGPIFNEDIARLCNRRKIVYCPGCGSATEISKAEEFGVEICKIFPGDSVGGPGFVKSILCPSPWTRVMPTAGVDATEESIAKWIKAGAACIGMGSKLITKELVNSGNFKGITDKAKNVLGWIKKARGK